MIRGITLRGAVALNVITMIGIGPLITIPLVLQKLHGPLALSAWILGAIVALCDGLVWAELASQYPGAGGTYAYLRDIFGAQRWGALFAFLYNWQFVLSASLIISTGYIGFAQYAAYLFPALTDAAKMHAAAFGVGLLTIALVYRRITSIAKLCSVLAVFAIGTIAIVAIAGSMHALSPSAAHTIHPMATPVTLGFAFALALGQALYITLYDYLGYAQVATVGEEVVEPRRTLPVSIVVSVFVVFVFYCWLQIAVLGAIPWQSLFDAHGAPTPQAQFVGSTVVQQSWGPAAAGVVTILVLITAFASLYGNLVGASRVPFAAARDGMFLPAFARLHPSGQFPYVAILGIGIISLIACFFSLDQVIAALIAASILGGSIAQIVALFVMRARGERAPFRMWLFPVPALVALAGWIWAFFSSGNTAMILGASWLAAGTIVFLLLAARKKAWPFVAACFVATCVLAGPLRAQAAKPPFVYGAAFFYERMPRTQWAPALDAYRHLGINTIDLYVMWNWHEPSDGNFDFDGRTNPRRDLRALLRLIHQKHFALILRPGPVIRNEWRNGGYPAWLLQRPEYNMPMRDIFEGRYPATATLQNAHSDAAAAEWLANKTHLRYARRWLDRVYALARPYRDDIVAIALDDDQGAYIDNDTWPAPNFHQYIHWLQTIANRDMPGVPTFINTYQMKVTASAPVWAWGNWYQSDAYTIGEHDRAQIEFSTGLLQTQMPQRAPMVSEFQAGWLQGADESQPRAADPQNTSLALHTFLQMGAHGVVNFPVQDTWNPSGWEAPWANAFYGWDAAFGSALSPQPRLGPTAAFGYIVSKYGARLAQTHPAEDAAIAYMTSAYDPRRITNDDVDAIAAATVKAQQDCRAARITCGLIDLRYGASRLKAYTSLILPASGVALPVVPQVRSVLAAFRRRGHVIASSVSQLHVPYPKAGGIPNAVLLVSNDERYGFIDVVNYSDERVTTPASTVHSGRFLAAVEPLTIPAHGAALIALRTPRAPYASAITGGTVGLHADIDVMTSDGYPHDELRGGGTLVVVSRCAGGRSFVFARTAVNADTNYFTTVGGFRDAWTPELAPSPRDYIAKYTHPIATGTFNRCYTASNVSATGATYDYTAPDAPGGPAHFHKTVSVSDGMVALDATATFAGSAEHAQSLTSFATHDTSKIVAEAHGFLIFSGGIWKSAMMIAYDGAIDAKLEPHDGNALLTLTYAPNTTLHARFAYAEATNEAEAQAQYAAFAKRAGP